LTIEWKPGKIIVTVRVEAYASTITDVNEADEADNLLSEDEEETETYDDEDEDGDYQDTGTVSEEEEDDYDDDEEEEAEIGGPPAAPPRGVDLTQLARSINAGLDDGEDGIGYAIAETHEIEVTTPGASDELTGDIMFRAYKGFDVICQQRDNKTKKIKTVEGRLVERNEEFIIINIKGRIKKMKNDTVVSVRLPKAKKEKGLN
jgi:ribosome maturation factor RimP